MGKVTVAEMQSDLEATRRDVERLTAIVENMEAFIRDSGGEYRRHLRADLMRWEGLRDEGADLFRRISDVLAKMTGEDN